jgi:hypothetical protein
MKATVTAAADRVLRICDDPPWLAHIELQSSRDPDLIPNLPVYTLWTATDVLMGLRYPQALVTRLLQGVHGMKESVTYQAIVEEGEIKGMLRARQEDLFRLGRRRFGAPNPETEAALRGVADPERLARLVDSLQDVSNWNELLATP